MGRFVGTAVALVTVLASGATPAAAQGSDDPLRVVVTVDGEDITGRTVTFDPARPVEVSLTVRNPGAAKQEVRLVRITGVALALTFFSYDTTVPFEVPSRGQVTRTFPLDVRDLDGQAIGLLPTTVALLSEDRVELASSDTVVDVRGSFWSVYGVFGVALLVLTALAWTGALLALARHRLSANRFRRALRFLPAGVGTGLVAVVTLSVLRLVPPEPEVEIPIVLGAAVIGLLLGFLTPHPAPAGPPDPTGDGPTVALTREWTR
ncbi:hypothetical protein [Actinokineospora spheciospongiae]|uniref:hypothetical protein n=1 Tax=Actinokineospora spheciospongiae TaxID=909613 RepID=UPI000D869D99|nr:hypothetical protein [Actinokineospora spheciospongiae]PWW65910.1 hypothetical protein DFQ13_102669 [Actinokineospora spheciospongiae]